MLCSLCKISHTFGRRLLILSIIGFLCWQQLSAQNTSGEGFADPVTPKSGQAKESKWFVRVYGSYGLPMASSFRPGDFTSSSSTSTGAPPTTTTTYKINRQGLGQGWRVGGGVGYIVNEVINLGIDVEQYWSGDISATREFSSLSSSYYSFSSNTYTAEMLTLTSNITFKAISKPNFYFCKGLNDQLIMS